MYKKILAGTILAAALLMAGCSGKTTQETTKSTEETTLSENLKQEKDSETESETLKETETAQEDAEGEIHTVIGTLEELSLEQVKLLSDNGNELTFPVEKAKIELPSGIRIGNLVAVDYTGKITETGTDKAEAVRITGSADTVTVREETEETQKNRNRAAGGEEETALSEEISLQGTIEKLSMTSMTLKDADGVKHSFTIIHVPMYFEKGLSKETKVEITYRMNPESQEEEDAEVLVIKTL